ncbi:uncharacterized protein AMSG_06231 [Thecamonas trahens ATCC 50062]|uniref:Mitochondrial escape protein 2 C-terminal domain-containing protein n=1 Tax=Thecamonas trahens ATCC 50062 TaxID=461836 RepID=A0A0L0DCT0_THETB|nr:hypothetical protein AMSG_06231 [Thecamonas trahens ATCC 50062]KNC49926.1 hypothetical protein AMSG_06231 [Thecamonas trahens ATCC 50062]|eukprot:XP_013757405.1 hypothetical protein AMSG_06231 [Thecamonas trahens ATCC 50062]
MLGRRLQSDKVIVIVIVVIVGIIVIIVIAVIVVANSQTGHPAIWVGSCFSLAGPPLQWMHALASSTSVFTALGLHRVTGGLISRATTATAAAAESALDQAGMSEAGVVPRLKEGGLVVYLPHEVTGEAVEAAAEVLRGEGSGLPIRARGDVHAIRGKPMLEDIADVWPSSHLSLVLPSKEMLASEVYKLLRPYGVLRSLTVSKDTASASYVTFTSAAAARVCLHEALDRKLLLEYVRKPWFAGLQAIASTPKLLPLVTILASITVSATAVLLIEPLRVFNVAQAVSSATIAGSDDDASFEREAQLLSRAVACGTLAALTDALETHRVLVIVGEPGMCKTRQVAAAVGVERKRVLRIACRARSSGAATANAFLDELEEVVGYRPSFSTLSAVFRYVEAFLPKGSELQASSIESRLEATLSTLAIALSVLDLQTDLLAVGGRSGRGQAVVVIDGLGDVLAELDAGAVEAVLETFVRWLVRVGTSARVVFVDDSDHAQSLLDTLLRSRSLDASALFLNDLSEGEAVQYLARYRIALSERQSRGGSGDGGTDEDAERESMRSALGKASHSLVGQLSLLWQLVGLELESHKRHEALADTQYDSAEEVLETVPPVVHSELLRVVDAVGGRIADLSEVARRAFATAGGAGSPLEALAKMQLEAERVVRRLAESAATPGKSLEVYDTIVMVARAGVGGESYAAIAADAFDGKSGALDELLKDSDVFVLQYDPTTQSRRVAAVSPLVRHACEQVAGDARVADVMRTRRAKIRLETIEEDIVKLMGKLEAVYASHLPSSVIGPRKKELLAKWNKLEAEKARILSSG